MTNTKMLKFKIEESGYKLGFISKKLGISYQAFLNKVQNKTEFKQNEIQKLCDLLDLTLKEKEEIFFNQNVE